MKALVVDGYNAIHKIPSLKAIMDESLSDARRKITELAKEYQRKCGGIDKVYVVFDGKDMYREMAPLTSENQVFSKTGEGDREIIRVVRRLSPKYNVEVISDDNFVRNNARAYNASVMQVSKFVEILDKQKKGAKKENNIEKVDPKTASKINEELKKHWNI